MPPPILDIVNACLSVVPVPGLSAIFEVFRALWSAIEAIEWSEQQLEALAFSIAQLLRTLNGGIQEGRIDLAYLSPEIANLEK
jgi:citrate lyase beta subunit